MTEIYVSKFQLWYIDELLSQMKEFTPPPIPEGDPENLDDQIDLIKYICSGKESSTYTTFVTNFCMEYVGVRWGVLGHMKRVTEMISGKPFLGISGRKSDHRESDKIVFNDTDMMIAINEYWQYTHKITAGVMLSAMAISHHHKHHFINFYKDVVRSMTILNDVVDGSKYDVYYHEDSLLMMSDKNSTIFVSSETSNNDDGSVLYNRLKGKYKICLTG